RGQASENRAVQGRRGEAVCQYGEPRGRWNAKVCSRLAAPEEPDGGGDAAADHEPGHRRADDHLLAVLRELRPPVRELADLRLEVVDGELELLAGALDRGPDLLGRTRCRHQ